MELLTVSTLLPFCLKVNTAVTKICEIQQAIQQEIQQVPTFQCNIFFQP